MLLRYQRSGPTNELAHGVASPSPLRQFVPALLVAGNHAALLEMTQAIGQQVGGYAGKPVLELARSDRAVGAARCDEQGPAVTHDVERSGHCAALVMGPPPPDQISA